MFTIFVYPFFFFCPRPSSLFTEKIKGKLDNLTYKLLVSGGRDARTNAHRESQTGWGGDCQSRRTWRCVQEVHVAAACCSCSSCSLSVWEVRESTFTKCSCCICCRKTSSGRRSIQSDCTCVQLAVRYLIVSSYYFYCLIAALKGTNVFTQKSQTHAEKTTIIKMYQKLLLFWKMQFTHANTIN